MPRIVEIAQIRTDAKIAHETGKAWGTDEDYPVRTDILKAETTYKTCNKCGRSLPLSAYGLQKGGKDGLRATCKECTSARQAEYQRRTRAKKKALQDPELKAGKVCHETYERMRKQAQEQRTKMGAITMSPMQWESMNKYRKLLGLSPLMILGSGIIIKHEQVGAEVDDLMSRVDPASPGGEYTADIVGAMTKSGNFVRPASLQDYPDAQLLSELKRRGFTGTLTKVSTNEYEL